MASQHENQKQQPSSKGKQPLVWRKNLRPAVECYWSDVDPAKIRRAIDAATRAGGAIMFGLTSDGGAYSLCILSGADKVKDYPHGAVECEETLLSIEQMFVE